MGQWTAADRARKKRTLENVLSSFLAIIRNNHPETNRPCTQGEALVVLRSMQDHAVAKFAEKDGFAVAGEYRKIIDEILGEMQRQATD